MLGQLRNVVFYSRREALFLPGIEFFNLIEHHVELNLFEIPEQFKEHLQLFALPEVFLFLTLKQVLEHAVAVHLDPKLDFQFIPTLARFLKPLCLVLTQTKEVQVEHAQISRILRSRVGVVLVQILQHGRALDFLPHRFFFHKELELVKVPGRVVLVPVLYP